MPLLLAVTVLPTHPAVKVHLKGTEDTRPISRCCLSVPPARSGPQVDGKPPKTHTLFLGSTSSWGARQEHKTHSQKQNRGGVPTPGGMPEHRHGAGVQPHVQEVSSKEETGAGMPTGGQAQPRALGGSNTTRENRKDVKAQGSPAGAGRTSSSSVHAHEQRPF